MLIAVKRRVEQALVLLGSWDWGRHKEVLSWENVAGQESKLKQKSTSQNQGGEVRAKRGQAELLLKPLLRSGCPEARAWTQQGLVVNEC